MTADMFKAVGIRKFQWVFLYGSAHHADMRVRQSQTMGFRDRSWVIRLLRILIKY